MSRKRDVVKRLREFHSDLCDEAADEIKRLLAANEYQADTIRKLNAHISYQDSELERLRPIDIYLDDPRVLLEIPQPHRMKLSEMLHGSEVSDE